MQTNTFSGPRAGISVVALMVAGAVAPAARAGHTNNIMITGYWPPTNWMVSRFSTNSELNPDGWIGGNWEGRGYNVYSFFPTFNPEDGPNWGKGTGDFEVDYQDTSADWQRIAAPTAYWAVLGVGVALLAALYAFFTFARLEIFKQLLASFFPLAIMILAVLGSIVFGLATPTEAAAIGSLGGFALAAIYGLLALPRGPARTLAWRVWIPLWLLAGVAVVWFVLLKFEVLDTPVPMWVGWMSIAAFALWAVVAVLQARLGPTVRESVFLTAKTSAMVCWLFVGSSIFSAAFALLGGQEIINRWVLSLDMTPVQFMLLAQLIIFLLGWPLEWTEIIVIFMPIFIPLLAHFQIDPLFFGLLVALNLQTAFLSPPVAMAAFYLKGVSPPHVTLNQIFAGMMPFMAIQVVALFLLYMFPGIGLWLPQVLYGR